MFTTDKVGHGYLGVYMELLAPLTKPAAYTPFIPRIVEIGIAGGEGLEMFRALCPNAEITGVDIRADLTWPGWARRVVCQQDAPELVQMLPGMYHLIVDDASHDNVKTATTFRNLWPKVTSGGLYVIEDWNHANGICASLARELPGLFLDPGADNDLDSITYRHGMIILRRKA